MASGCAMIMVPPASCTTRLRRPSMAILPRFVILVIIAHLDAVLLWFSDLIYAELLKHADDHLLVKLHAHLDVTPLEQACAAFQHASGPGAPVTHPVARLVRAFLVKYLFAWSL